MKIVYVRAFEGLNTLAPVPVVRLVVDFGNLFDRSPAALGPGFTDNLLEFLPELEAASDDGAKAEECFATALRHDESLRLGHVVARVALELQRIAGAEVSYCRVKTNSGGASGHQTVYYAHWDSKIGIVAGRAAVAAVGHLVKASLEAGDAQVPGWNPADYRRELLSIIVARSLDITTAALVREAIRRDIPWRRLNARTRVVQFGHGRFQKRILETLTSDTPSIAASMSRDKGTSNLLMSEAGLPVPAHTVINLPDKAAEAAELTVAATEKIGYPVVLKPLYTNKGRGISVNLADAAAVRRAVHEALKYGNSVIVEKFIEGDDHRILVVDGKMVAAAKRIPGHVVGDGRCSITELVENTNRDPRRGRGFENVMTYLEFDAQAERVLSEQGLVPDSVPAADQVVYLRRTANISTGGTAVDVTDIIHPDNGRAAVRAAVALGLDVAGVDFLSTDISISYRENGAAICEINSCPGLRPHWLADDTRDVVGPVLDMLYPPGAPSRVPIAAITGTNGKTTTTRMVVRILEHAGHVVGFSSTDGTYIDGELVAEGDMAGGKGARLVLQSPEIDAAVLETARRGIIIGGLAFDWCDVGAVLNVDDDHIGTDGIRDMDDLARIKSLVAMAARKTVVLNADDARCVGMAESTRAQRLSYVTMMPDNRLIAEHTASGGVAVILRPAEDGPVIEIHEDGAALEVVPAFDLPTAMNGKAMHNVQNAMFATAIAHGLGMSPEFIRSGLRSLGCGPVDTPGRLNIFDRLPFNVIVDYAHNPQQFEAITAVVKQLDCNGRRIVMFTSPGNRTDQQLRNLADAAAGAAYDHYICFRRDDLRGRGPSEVPELLRDGLLANGVPHEKVSVVPPEEEAVASALDMARPGDIVILLYTDHEKTWDLLTAASR